jgi:hypothetical protein
MKPNYWQVELAKESLKRIHEDVKEEEKKHG